ncbi:MAG: hypothetical protein ACOC22_01330 [bacterium]
MSKEIKISEAKKIAKEYDYDMVIIIGINNDSSGHVTTYGKNKGFCKIAGHIGQKELAPKLFSDNGILANLDFTKLK